MVPPLVARGGTELHVSKTYQNCSGIGVSTISVTEKEVQNIEDFAELVSQASKVSPIIFSSISEKVLTIIFCRAN